MIILCINSNLKQMIFLC